MTDLDRRWNVIVVDQRSRQYERRALTGDFRRILQALDEHGVSREPVYTAYGLEVYENPETKTQVRVNWDTDAIEVIRGY